MKRYDPSTENIETLATDLPSDPNAPERRNNVAPEKVRIRKNKKFIRITANRIIVEKEQKSTCNHEKSFFHINHFDNRTSEWRV